MPDMYNVQIRLSPELKKLLHDTSQLARFPTMSAFIRYALLKEITRTLRSLSLNNEINGMLHEAERLAKETG